MGAPFCQLRAGAIASSGGETVLEMVGGYVLNMGTKDAEVTVDGETQQWTNGASRHGFATASGNAIAGTGMLTNYGNGYATSPYSSDWDLGKIGRASCRERV